MAPSITLYFLEAPSSGKSLSLTCIEVQIENPIKKYSDEESITSCFQSPFTYLNLARVSRPKLPSIPSVASEIPVVIKTMLG